MTEAAQPEHPAPRRSRLALRFAIAFLLGVVLVIGLGAGALYAWSHQYQGRVLPGVRVGATDLSGMTPDAATAAIDRTYASLGNGQLVLAGPDGDTTVPYAAISRGPDTVAMLDVALGTGRRGAPLGDLIGVPQAALHGLSLPVAVTYDHAKLVAAVDALAATIDRASIDATVTTAADGSFLPASSKPGRAVDRAALVAAVDAQLGRLDAPAQVRIEVPVKPVNPTVDTAAANAAKAAADRIATDLVFTKGSDRWAIPGSRVRSLISFSPSADGGIVPVVDQGGLDPLLTALAGKVNQSAKNASFQLSGSTVLVTSRSREGRTMDVAATRDAVLGVLAARQAGTTEPPLAPVVAVVPPAISSDLAGGAASKMQVIGQHTTWFPIWIRNGFGANIWVPAKMLNGYVVAPGATFDFWKVIGDPTPAMGFKQGNAIINGHSDPLGAFAGGICSCSTTLFNAALNAGMKMGARQNHYYYINRYPMGLDATVWISGGTKQTMSFTNDTPYPVLIQGINTRSGSKGFVTFKIWSVPNGRTVKIGAPTVKNFNKAHDSTVYVSTLPKGATNRVETPEDGLDAWRTVTVYQDGTLLRSTTYYSHYATVTGILEVGTGGSTGPGPSPSPGSTPAPTLAPTPAPTPPPAP